MLVRIPSSSIYFADVTIFFEFIFMFELKKMKGIVKYLKIKCIEIFVIFTIKKLHWVSKDKGELGLINTLVT